VKPLNDSSFDFSAEIEKASRISFMEVHDKGQMKYQSTSPKKDSHVVISLLLVKH